MLLSAAAALALPPVPAGPSARVQAIAVIRIIKATVLRFDGSANPGTPPPRTLLVKRADWSTEQLKLIEFQ